jgi:hypothetical protein
MREWVCALLVVVGLECGCAGRTGTEVRWSVVPESEIPWWEVWNEAAASASPSPSLIHI